MAKALVRENFVVGDIITATEQNSNSKNANSILKTLVAGETITLGKPCFIADGSVCYEEIKQIDSAGGSGNPIYAGTNLGGQTFRTKASPYVSVTLKEIQAYIAKTGTPSGNVTINIYAVDANHKPTGASLGSASITTASVGSAAFYTFTFNLALSAGTEYAMVMSVPSGTGANYVSWYYNSNDGTIIPEGWVIESSNSGSTWSTNGASDRTIKLKYTYIYGTAGRVYHSYAGDKNRSYFDCFSQESKTVGQNCVCQFGNLAEDLASLTIGDRYFLEDFNASIASITTGTTEDQFYTNNWIAQTFTTASDQVAITKLVLDLKRTNNPSGDLTISIRATSAGLPTGADLAVRTYPDCNMFPTGSFKTLTVEFDTPLAVSPSTVYAVVVRIAGGVNSSNSLNWKSDGANPYASGQKATSSNAGSSWTAVSGSDMNVLIYGYSKKVLATPVSWEVLLGQALSATELFIEKEEHVIYKQTVSESNTSGAGSSCEATYYIPPRTKKIIINGSFSNGSQTGYNQLNLEIPHLVSAKVHDENSTNDLALTATISGNQLTINSQYLSGTPTFALDIIYIGR